MASPILCTDLWLVRHGSRQDVEQPAWLDTAERPHDPPLAPNGQTQASETAAWIARELQVDHLLASPFLRAMQTATPIAAATNRPIQVEAGLAELFYDRWFPFDPDLPDATTLAVDFPTVDTTSPGLVHPVWPEDEAAVNQRAQDCTTAITQTYAGTVVCVCHGGIISKLSAAIYGSLPPGLHPRLCCLIHFQRKHDTWHMCLDGSDSSHLSITEETLRIF